MTCIPVLSGPANPTNFHILVVIVDVTASTVAGSHTSQISREILQIPRFDPEDGAFPPRHSTSDSRPPAPFTGSGLLFDRGVQVIPGDRANYGRSYGPLPSLQPIAKAAADSTASLPLLPVGAGRAAEPAAGVDNAYLRRIRRRHSRARRPSSSSSCQPTPPQASTGGADSAATAGGGGDPVPLQDAGGGSRGREASGSLQCHPSGGDSDASAGAEGVLDAGRPALS